MNIQLKKVNMTDIKDDKVVVLIGKRETGKSFLVKDLLYYHQNIPIGTVISGTESANSFYSDIIPSLFIHDEYTSDLINNVVKRQKIVVKKYKRDLANTGRSRVDPRAFLILDDCLYDKSWIKDTNIRTLFMNGRHYNMMFIITISLPWVFHQTYVQM